jgi:Zn-dependent protease
MQVGRLTRVATIRGVDIYVHWTVFLLIAFLLAGVARDPRVVIALPAYLTLLMLHESGHIAMARLRGYQAFHIAVYPFFGLTAMQAAESQWDRALIAWGGVAAQLLVALPIVAAVSVLGYTRYPALNLMLTILGNYSLLVAAFNLLPIRPLDGSVAWSIIPAFFRRHSN